MSSLKESEEQTSSCASPRCLGEHVASSHFSNTRASRGNRGCLRGKGNEELRSENQIISNLTNKQSTKYLTMVNKHQETFSADQPSVQNKAVCSQKRLALLKDLLQPACFACVALLLSPFSRSIELVTTKANKYMT